MVIDISMQPRRSLIFCPGNRPDRYPKAVAAGADVVCIDLEDAIPPEEKAEARRLTLALFHDPPPADGVERVVRINSLREPQGLADISAVLECRPGLTALMLPKVKSPDEVRIVDDLLGACGLETRLQVIIETNDGLDAAYEIAQASPRLDALLFGAVDMAAELRIPASWKPLLYARSRLVHAAAGAGVDLLDVPYLDLQDEGGLKAEAILAADLGFTGKATIHPKQIPVVNQTFSPDAKAVARARHLVAGFEAAQGGLFVEDGKLIEKPVVRSMYRILAVAKRMGIE